MNDIRQALKILIVDDNPDDRDNYVRLLKKSPDIACQCHEAAEGKKGLEALQSFDPDCILLDYSLPGSNGIDVLCQIKAKDKYMPVIMLTGQGNEEIAVQAMKLGADDYLVKSSMTVQNLSHAIRMSIEHGYLQRKIEEQTHLLLVKETRYQQLINGVHDYAFCWLDLEGKVESWNSGAEKIMGYAAEEIINSPASRFYTEEDRRDLVPEKSLEQALATGKFSNECWYVKKDGSLFWASVQIDCLRDARGNPVGFVKITRDITERRNAEIERTHLMEKLMQSNTELERFAYVASHDMQEPVRMVVNFSRIIARDFSDRLDAEGRECLNFITESADRIHDMIDDLLDYARIGSEGGGFTEVDGMSEIGHVLNNLDALVKERGARVTYDELPVFPGNPVQFMRLMQNLIANAIKYQPPGNMPEIHIGVEDEADALYLSVRDNGVGIDESFSQTIFEPFRRLHNWEQIKGTGLGLAVCKKIVENHGGTIWVESKIGHGSTFFIVLPKQRPDAQMVA